MEQIKIYGRDEVCGIQSQKIWCRALLLITMFLGLPL